MKLKVLLTGLCFVAVSAPLLLTGCSPSGKFGAPVIAKDETAISDILDNPASFEGKTVMVKGQVATVDDDGLGFQLDNGLGSLLYVEVAGDFKISSGAKYHLTTAEGKIVLEKDTGTPRLTASGIDVK
ncbi:MAG TPA: hypothetical protein VMX79_04840 [bacterium]|nr:hypothetical protein [bacterium]